MSRQLNPRQLRFISEYIKTGVAARAYIAAGYRPTTRNALDVSACQLLSHPKIRGVLSERTRKVLKKSDFTIEKLLNDVAEDRELARNLKQPGAAISATQLAAKLVGLLIERKEAGVPGAFDGLRTREEIEAKIRADMGDEAAELFIKALREPEAQPTAPGTDSVN